MTATTPDIDIDLTDLTPEEWLDRLDTLGEEHGYFERLGPRHVAMFVDAGPNLLVTFETVEAARRLPGAAPAGLDHVTRNGWSLLALLSEGETWFRDPAVWGTFDRLTDDGFFEDFERVLFTGAGPSGYAAAAYSVAAPGARVLAFRPYATLDPALAGWDKRHMDERRRDFTSRYGYAPEMLDAASRAWVVHDPAHAPDATHASLYHRANVTLLRAPYAGPRPEGQLEAMEAMAELLEMAMDGRLDRVSFARLWRRRRSNVSYLRSLSRRLEKAGRDGLLARVARHGLSTRDRPLYERKLQELGLAVPGLDDAPGAAPGPSPEAAE